MYSYSEITAIFSNCLSRNELEKALSLILEVLNGAKPVPGTRIFTKQRYYSRLQELINSNPKNQRS